MLRHLFLTILLALSLSACSQKASTLPPPTETVTFITPATPTPGIVSPINSTPIPETPTVTTKETASPEFTPTQNRPSWRRSHLFPLRSRKPPRLSTAIPTPSTNSGAIQFYGPGPQSKIVSPLVLYGYAIPGYKRKGQVDLYGEDGRVIGLRDLAVKHGL